MKKLLLFICILAGLIGCHKKETELQNLCAEPAIVESTCTTDSSRLPALIIGKWNWTQSISSWTNQKTNPCTDTVNRSYEFLSNGTVKYYRNGNYVSTGNYHLSSAGISASDNNSTFALAGWVSICGSYLIIDDSPVDGPKDIYIKAD